MSIAKDSITTQESLDHALDIYPFSDPKQQLLFDKMIHTLRCSVCQNQNLADSMAPLAIDLKSIIYKQVLNDFKEEAILEFVSHRYGDFVRYDPPMMWSTALLWFGPLMMLCMASLFLKKSLCRELCRCRGRSLCRPCECAGEIQGVRGD